MSFVPPQGYPGVNPFQLPAGGSTVLFPVPLHPQFMPPPQMQPQSQPTPPQQSGGLHAPLVPTPLHPPLTPQKASSPPGGLQNLPSATDLFSSQNIPRPQPTQQPPSVSNPPQPERIIQLDPRALFAATPQNPLFSSQAAIPLRIPQQLLPLHPLPQQQQLPQHMLQQGQHPLPQDPFLLQALHLQQALLQQKAPVSPIVLPGSPILQAPRTPSALNPEHVTVLSPPGSQGSTNPFLDGGIEPQKPVEDPARREKERQQREIEEKDAFLKAQKEHIEKIQKEHEERLRKEREIEEQKRLAIQQEKMKAEQRRIAEENQRRLEMFAALEQQEKLILAERQRLEEEERKKLQAEAEAREKLRLEQERLVQEQIMLQHQLMEQERLRYERQIKEQEMRRQQALMLEKARLDEQLRMEKELLEKAQLEAEAEELKRQQEVLDQEKRLIEQERLKREALRQEALKYEQEREAYQQRKQELEEFERQRQLALQREQAEMERQIQIQREQIRIIEEGMRKDREKALEEMRQATLLLQQQEQKAREEKARLKAEQDQARSVVDSNKHKQPSSPPTSGEENFNPFQNGGPPVSTMPGGIVVFHQTQPQQPQPQPYPKLQAQPQAVAIKADPHPSEPAIRSPPQAKKTKSKDLATASPKGSNSARTRKTSFKPESSIGSKQRPHTPPASYHDNERPTSPRNKPPSRSDTPSPPQSEKPQKAGSTSMAPQSSVQDKEDEERLKTAIDSANRKEKIHRMLEEEKSSRTLVSDALTGSTPLENSYEELLRRTDGKVFKCRYFASPEVMNKRSMGVKAFLHIYYEGILLLDKKKKRIVEKYSITQVRRYVMQKKFILIDCGSHREGYMVLECGKNTAAEIIRILDANIAHLAKIYQKQSKIVTTPPQPHRGQEQAKGASELKDRKAEEDKRKALEQEKEREKPKEPERAKEKEPSATNTSAIDRTIDLSDVPKGKKKRNMKPMKKKKSKADDMTLQRVGHTEDVNNYLRMKDKPYFSIWLPNHDSSQPEHIFKINKKRRQFTIGSGATNDLVLADPLVAAQQAQVKETDGFFVLQDPQPERTKVDGVPITAPVKLQPGSVVSMGQTKIVVCNRKINAPVKKIDDPKSFQSPKLAATPSTVSLTTQQPPQENSSSLPPRPSQPPPVPVEYTPPPPLVVPHMAPPKLPPPPPAKPEDTLSHMPPPRPPPPTHNPFDSTPPPLPSRPHAQQQDEQAHYSAVAPVLNPPPPFPTKGALSPPSPPPSYGEPTRKLKKLPPAPQPQNGGPDLRSSEMDSLAAALRELNDDASPPQEEYNPFTTTTTSSPEPLVEDYELDSLAETLRELKGTSMYLSSPPRALSPPVYQPPLEDSTNAFIDEEDEGEYYQEEYSPNQSFVPPSGPPPPLPPGREFH